MPEGDTIRRLAERLRELEGEVVAAESPHPRAASLGIARRIDGRRLERVEAIGKHLLLTFDGGVTVRSHLRMKGRWTIEQAGRPVVGLPWLVLRGTRSQAVLTHGPVLALGRGGLDALGPDLLAGPPDLDGIVARLRATDQGRALGEALLDQRLVAGIGNLWRSEALFRASVSPFAALGELDDAALRQVLQVARDAMLAGRGRLLVYRRGGRPCVRCGVPVSARRTGEQARIVYWCPRCQAGSARAKA